jgi:glutamyl-tRNA synthetase
LNFVVRLGWSHGNDEVISRQQMIEWFGFDHVGTTSGVWNPEKLLWLNHHYVKAAQPHELEGGFLWQLRERGIEAEPGARTLAIIKSQQERSHTLAEMAELSLYFFREPPMDEKARAKFLTAETRPALSAIRDALASFTAFTAADVEPAFKQTAEKLGVGLGKVAQPVRVALTGSTVSPPIQELVTLLGKDVVLSRLDRAISAVAG